MLGRCEVVLQDREKHAIWTRWTDEKTVIRTDVHTGRRSEGRAFRRQDSLRMSKTAYDGLTRSKTI